MNEDDHDKDVLVYKNGMYYVNGNPVEKIGFRGLFRERKVYDDAVYQVAPILSMVSLAAFIVFLIIAVIGVVLVCVGATGDSTIKLFGQELTTASVGLVVIFISAVSLVLLIRRVMKSLDLAVSTKGNRRN